MMMIVMMITTFVVVVSRSSASIVDAKRKKNLSSVSLFLPDPPYSDPAAPVLSPLDDVPHRFPPARPNQSS